MLIMKSIHPFHLHPFKAYLPIGNDDGSSINHVMWVNSLYLC